MYTSMNFNIFTDICNYLPINFKTFSPPKNKHYAIYHPPIHLSSPSPKPTLICFLSPYIFLFRFSYELNHIMLRLLWYSLSVSIMFARLYQGVAYPSSPFLFNCQMILHFLNTPNLIYPFIGRWPFAYYN